MSTTRQVFTLALEFLLIMSLKYLDLLLYTFLRILRNLDFEGV